MTTSSLRDLIDEQFAVSGAAARLAAARASGADVRRLYTLVRQLSGASTLGSRIRADCRFHIEVAQASQSERLTRLEVGLQTQLGDFDQKTMLRQVELWGEKIIPAVNRALSGSVRRSAAIA